MVAISTMEGRPSSSKKEIKASPTFKSVISVSTFIVPSVRKDCAAARMDF